jgi:hypothetical protein
MIDFPKDYDGPITYVVVEKNKDTTIRGVPAHFLIAELTIDGCMRRERLQELRGEPVIGMENTQIIGVESFATAHKLFGEKIGIAYRDV